MRARISAMMRSRALGRSSAERSRKVAALVMTSNLGSQMIMQMVGEPTAAIRDAVWTEVKAHFRPEFLNRIDEIILFSRLDRANMDSIVKIQLSRVEKLLADRRMTLSVEPDALHWLGERGYDPVYGARPLKRVIQKELMDPIARRLLAGDLADGAVIAVTAGEGGLALNKATVN